MHAPLLPASLRIAIGFLTRIPAGAGTYADRSFGRALAWFPFIGCCLGALLLLAHFLLSDWLPLSVIAVSLVALWAALTGGLHLDGLADSFDGFSGGRGQPARILEIMRDSHIGAHGAAALSLFCIAKVAAVFELLSQGDEPLLLACPALARFGVVALMLAFPYAREQGLGTTFRSQVRWLDLALGSLPLCAALLWLGTASLAPAFACMAVMLLVAGFVNRRLGGLTGDIYGAAIELGELAFLIAAARY
jgi:adenosylcobinamide-GDP ribazoletransferase